MAQVQVEIINKLGLHARASSKFTQLAGRYASEIWISRNNRRVNAKSIPKVYSLIVVLFILIGSSLKVDLVWALADFFNGLMAVPNLLALLALSGVVAGIARNKKD